MDAAFYAFVDSTRRALSAGEDQIFFFIKASNTPDLVCLFPLLACHSLVTPEGRENKDCFRGTQPKCRIQIRLLQLRLCRSIAMR